jgi:WhiB family transcriptional regulator, redox-sensing transcriptional regulator
MLSTLHSMEINKSHNTTYTEQSTTGTQTHEAKQKNDDINQQSIDENWEVLAECKDFETKVFYPTDGAGVNAAKAICNQCVVKIKCLEYAIARNEIHGVWGGTSERERKQIIKLRKKEATTAK